MSSDLQITKMCMGCGKLFNAKQHRTKYCSHRCNQIHYKDMSRNKRIAETHANTQQQVAAIEPAITSRVALMPLAIISKELLNIKEVAGVCGLSERTLFRMMKDDDFPKMRIGRRLVFQKESVLNFITRKFGNHERKIAGTQTNERQDHAVH